jgi:putative FmdB family regulatory protein
MPIYEFRCADCSRRSAVFTRSVSVDVVSLCEHCGSANTSRVFSRVAVLKGDSGGGFDESSFADLDDSDPRAMAKWLRKMSREAREPIEPEMEAELERMEAGEMPDDFAPGPDEDFAEVD